jgi:DNA-binding transcriptional regulator YiaG
MIDRNEAGADMDGFLGQCVLKIKTNVSHDYTAKLGQNCPMAGETSESIYKQQFIKRVRQARDGRGLKQHEIAEVLQIDQGKYKQYETRSLLPHYLVPRFCTVCAVDIGWLFTGRGRAPIEILPLARVVNRKRKTKSA